MVTEKWMPIHQYEEAYLVSSFGKIKSISRNRNLRLSLTINGYPKVRLFKNNVGITKYVHRLVAEAFYGKSDLVVNHKDNNKQNNHLSNLEWVTSRENTTHSRKLYNSYSKYIGVSYYKKNKKWSATIFIDGKNRFLGLFQTEIEAKKAYQNKLLTLKT